MVDSDFNSALTHQIATGNVVYIGQQAQEAATPAMRLARKSAALSASVKVIDHLRTMLDLEMFAQDKAAALFLEAVINAALEKDWMRG